MASMEQQAWAQRERGLSNPIPRARHPHTTGSSAPPTPSLTVDMPPYPSTHLNGTRSGPNTPLGRTSSSSNLPPGGTRPATSASHSPSNGGNGNGSRSETNSSTVAPSAASSGSGSGASGGSGSVSRATASKRAGQLPSVPESQSRRRAASSAAARIGESTSSQSLNRPTSGPRHLRLHNPKPGMSEAHAFPPEIYRKGPLPTPYHDKPACALLPHWSLAGGWGAIPTNGYRNHTGTLVDNIIWYFGGHQPPNPEDIILLATTRPRKTFRNVRCFDTESQCWSYPEMQGEQPPHLRSSSAALLDDSKIILFGGGIGEGIGTAAYVNQLWCLDTKLRLWSNLTPKIKENVHAPIARRSHSAVIYNKRMYIFGGGSGSKALNDCWMLDLSNLAELEWVQVNASNPGPSPRGYHTANLVQNGMIVYGGTGGSTGKDDMWLLDLDTHEWREIKPTTEKRVNRFAHTSTVIGNYLFVFGGMEPNSSYGCSLEIFNLLYREWTDFTKPDCFFKATGIPPSNRGYHTAVLNDSRLWVFGGYDGNEHLFDNYALDLGSLAYMPHVTNWEISDIFSEGEEELGMQ